jgi:S1-C subfamily serine protease
VPEASFQLMAEVLVTGPAGAVGGRGSGYRGTDDVVLTAEHVVRGRTKITVRFDADQATEWSASASVMWSDAAKDSALLILHLPPGTAGIAVATATYGRVGDWPAVIDAQAVGFPWWKLRACGDHGRAA